MRLLRLCHFKQLVLILLIVSIFGCSAKQTIKPAEVSNYDLTMLIDELKTIKSIEATLEVEYEKGDASAVSGDMYLKIDEHTTVLRIYYLGFLAGEIIEQDGVIKSKGKISKRRAEMLLKAVKRGIFWWRSDFNQVIDSEEHYYLSSEDREVVIDKKKLLPISQRIALDDGEAIDISYSDPLPIDPTKEAVKPSDWYQSNVVIEYLRYRVNAKITSVKIIRLKNNLSMLTS